MSGLQVLTSFPRNSVNALNHSVKVIGGGVSKDKDIIGQNDEYFIN